MPNVCQIVGRGLLLIGVTVTASIDLRGHPRLGSSRCICVEKHYHILEPSQSRSICLPSLLCPQFFSIWVVGRLQKIGHHADEKGHSQYCSGYQQGQIP